MGLVELRFDHDWQLFRHGFGYRLREFHLFGGYQFVFRVVSTMIAIEQSAISSVIHMRRVSYAQSTISLVVDDIGSCCRLAIWLWRFHEPSVLDVALD